MVSSGAYIWFGIPGRNMQWVPAPQAGFQRSWSGAQNLTKLNDGRQEVSITAQTHSTFNGTFFGDYNDPNGINLDIFHTFASGYWGTGSLCFGNPYNFQQNMFSPSFATPGLSKYGWTEPASGIAAYPSITVAGGRSSVGLTVPIGTGVNLPASNSTRYNQYLPIPPGYTLYIGWSGSVTGTAGVMVQPYNTDNSLASATLLTPLSPTSTSQTNATYSGSTYNAVRVYVTRTSSAASTITMSSMMARLYPTGQTPPSTYNHVPGQGNLGLKIVGDAIAESYLYAGVKKSLTLTLEEVL